MLRIKVFIDQLCKITLVDQPPKQWLTGRKRGEDEGTKVWISQQRKKLFRWNKKYLS